MKKTVMLAVLFSVVTASGLTAFTQTLGNESFLLQIAEAENPNACNTSLTDLKGQTDFAFKTPRGLPESYKMQDGYLPTSGEVHLFYAPGPKCGPDAEYATIEDGLVQYMQANMDSMRTDWIENPEEKFKAHKASVPIPEKVHLFEINGNPAMGWESGIRQSLVIDHNGEVIHSEDLPHPAQVRVVDKASQEYYYLKGYLPLEQLKDIISKTME